MAEHKDAAVIRKGYEAFGKADMETLAELIAEDAVWHVSGHSPLSGEYRGRDSIFTELFGRIATLSEGTMQLELHDIVANDEHVVAITQSTARRGDKVLDSGGVGIYHVRDGKLREAWTIGGDQQAEATFWS